MHSEHSKASIFAIVVGINAYEKLPQLRNSVSDAEKVSNFLEKELNAKVFRLYDAKKDKILEVIKTLPSQGFKPSDVVLFFFSGWAGKASVEKSDSLIGTICPVDTGMPINDQPERQTTGIPDSMLIGLFDQISRSHGNNITLFLDCNSDIFNWGNPNSCVVVTPEVAVDIDGGGAFVTSLLNVLKKEKEEARIQSLTVQSLAKRIQVDNNGNRAVHCFGKNADGFLLDRTRGGAYHSFIFGQKEIGGRIILSAGAAQGIEPGTRLAFFVSDVKDEWNDKRGYLVVGSASATSAIVSSPDDNKEILPNIFYAVETQYPKETIRVRIEGEQPEDGPFQPKLFSWVKQEQDNPNITLKFEDEWVTFLWNGLESDNKRRGNYMISKFRTSEILTRRMLRNAARLTYHLSRPSPANALAKGLHIQLQEITGRKPSGKDLLQDGCMSKKLTESDILGPYCLVVENKTGTDLWPYVFTLDPMNLNIIPWYLPSPDPNQPPLKDGDSLLVGCGDDEGLLFEGVLSSAILYIRVFVTTEKTNFSFLQQQWLSPTEDRVRELESNPVNLVKPRDSADDAGSSQGKKFATFGSTWAATMATIVLEMEGSPNPKEPDSVENFEQSLRFHNQVSLVSKPRRYL